MPWVKLDDGLAEHRKTRRLLRAGGHEAMSIHLLAIVNSSKYLTDGHVDEEFVEDMFDVGRIKPKQRERIITALVESGQWTVDEERGGWVIHDYLVHNPSAEQVEANRGVDRYRKELSRDTELLSAIRKRDGAHCRYCGVEVNWKDRRSSVGGTYDHLVPVSQGGENTYDNVVVSCRGCNQRKGPRTPEGAQMTLLPVPASSPAARSDLPGARSDRPQVSASRPDPSHTRPMNNPPNPPEGGTVPGPPPQGGREREQRAWEQSVEAWCAARWGSDALPWVLGAAKDGFTSGYEEEKVVRWVEHTRGRFPWETDTPEVAA